MRATIIIVTYNHATIVPRCLDALRSTTGPNDEVLVVDNASVDGTASLIAAAYPWLRVESLPTNAGFGAGCNHGARLARGDVLVFLNPDTEPRQGWLDALLDALAPDPERTLVTAKLLLARAPHLVDTFGNDVHISGITTCRYWERPAATVSRPEEVSAVSGACFAVSRRLFQELGGFDERLFLYFEDTDLSLRARFAGLRCLAVPDSVVVHDHRPGFSPAKLRYLERNRWWTLLKLYHWRTLVGLTPVLILAETLAWAMAVRSGPGHVVAKAAAYGDLIRWLPLLSAARAATQRLRVVSDGRVLWPHSTRLTFAQTAGFASGWAETLTAWAFGGGRAVAAAVWE